MTKRDRQTESVREQTRCWMCVCVCVAHADGMLSLSRPWFSCSPAGSFAARLSSSCCGCGCQAARK